MKNSLFKRAIAVASAVPVALAQCLTVANAVYVDYSAPVAVKSAESTSFTLDKGDSTSLLYIAPEEDYARNGDTFTKDSQWNGRVAAALAQNAGKKDTLDLSKFYDKAIEKSGEYSEVTASLIDKIEYVNYSISDDGKITIEGKLNNITPAFTAGGAKTIGGALREIGIKYGVEELYEPEKFFDDTVIGCTFKAVIDASTLADGTEVAGTFELTDTATGEVFKGTAAIDWALEGFNTLKDTAKATCEMFSEIDGADANSMIDDSVIFYVDKLEKAWNKALETYKTTSSVEAATGRDFAKIANEKVLEKTGKNPFAIMWNKSDLICSFYEDILAQVNTIVDPYTFDIAIDECEALALGLYDIKSSTSNGYATFEAKFEDKEADAAEKYIEANYNVEVLDVYKTVYVVADLTTISDELGGKAVVDMKYERVVEVKDLDETTTTTAADVTTTTTVADVTTTVADVTTTVADVTTTVADVTTTVADVTTTVADVTTTVADVTTTVADVTTTVADVTTTVADVTTTVADVTTTVADVTTTVADVTTTTEEVPDGTTTTTTDVTPGDTTTRTETKYVVNFKTETVPGFYLDIDKEFNIEQVKSVGYSVDYSTLYYGEDGALIKQDVLEAGKLVDITDSVEIKDVPADVAKLLTNDGVNQFAAAIQLYATKDITAADGTEVAKSGDKLTFANGAPVAVTAYIGVKGDANLDMKCDSSDASIVLAWYANSQTGGDTSRFTSENVVVDEYPILDDFAAFLADVDNENDSANYIMLKNERKMNSTDASFILAYYAKVSTGSPAGRDTWNGELGEWGKY